MTPKEKAKELVDKMYGDELDYMTEGQAKQCALVAVDEIIKSLPPFDYGLEFVAKIVFWKEVKKEI
jgi:hypothetical protein